MKPMNYRNDSFNGYRSLLLRRLELAECVRPTNSRKKEFTVWNMRIFKAKFRFRFASPISFPESEINLPENKICKRIFFVVCRCSSCNNNKQQGYTHDTWTSASKVSAWKFGEDAAVEDMMDVRFRFHEFVRLRSRWSQSRAWKKLESFVHFTCFS